MKPVDFKQFKQKNTIISDIISNDDLLQLKQVHKNNTGIELSDLDALAMGLRLIDLFRVIGQKIEFSN